MSKPAIEILHAVREQQARDGLYDPNGFVFGNYRTYNPTSARMGVPPTRTTVRNLLQRKVSAQDADKTMHGMRRTFGGWARQQGYPEPDIERALTHISGYGQTDLARIYSGHATREVPLAQLFAAWANYCQRGELPAQIIQLRQVINERSA